MAPTPINKKFKRRTPTVTFVEPKRSNLLDVLMENMALASRNIYVHRLIYVGRHSFGPGYANNVSAYFRDIIQSVNSEYYDEPLTGFFLYYTRYFCHVIEGSENTLKKHLHLVYNSSGASNIERIKLLVAYHNINQRFLDGWTELTAKPPTLLEKIDINKNLQDTTMKVINCIHKLYKLGSSLRLKTESKSYQSDVAASDSEAEENIQKVKSTITQFDEIGRPSDALPECNLLDFLIESHNVRDLLLYVHAFGAVPILQKYEDHCWPAPVDYIPRNIFEKDLDPITDLQEQDVDQDII